MDRFLLVVYLISHLQTGATFSRGSYGLVLLPQCHIIIRPNLQSEWYFHCLSPVSRLHITAKKCNPNSPIERSCFSGLAILLQLCCGRFRAVTNKINTDGCVWPVTHFSSRFNALSRSAIYLLYEKDTKGLSSRNLQFICLHSTHLSDAFIESDLR